MQEEKEKKTPLMSPQYFKTVETLLLSVLTEPLLPPKFMTNPDQ